MEKYVIAAVLLLLLVISTVLPLCTMAYSEIAGMFVDRLTSNTTKTEVTLLRYFGGGRHLSNATDDERYEALSEDSWSNFYLSTVLVLVMVPVLSICINGMNFVALRQTTRIRKVFLQSILSQDMTWFDSRNSLDFASKLTSNLDLMKDAIGEKILSVVLQFSCFVLEVAISFVAGWELTLIVAGIYTITLIGFSLYVGKQVIRLTEKELESYSVAGSIAEEVFSSIRTVVAFGGEGKEAERYAESVKMSEKFGIRKSFFTGLQSCIMWFLVFGSFGLTLFIGVILMIRDIDLLPEERRYNIVNIILVVFLMVDGSQYLTLSLPSLEALVSAVGASKTIYNIIDQKPGIDPFSTDGIIFERLEGNVEFRNVHFQYPSRPEVQVLKGINFIAKVGQSIALVGRSGCGKSTCLQLLQRLYDTSEGTVFVDGINIKHFNTAFLRSQIGVVGQEPVLFSATIADNIRFGNTEATMEEIQNAAKIANCHSFIEKLPLGYTTLLGENGAQLSGGQKQRIAIARAIVRNPKILLLDEATSALDSESERIVQKALDKASIERTTIIVSHRLSSIRNVDQIFVFDQGTIVEQGTHNELMDVKGIYHSLQKTNLEVFSANNPENDTSESNEVLSSIENQCNEIPEVNYKDIVSNDNKKDKDKSMSKIFKMSLVDWKLLAIGFISSMIMGSSFPFSGFIHGQYFESLKLDDTDQIVITATYNLVAFIAVSLSVGFGALGQTYAFGKAGVRLTSLLRVKCFKTAMKQEISWFDQPSNSVGALSARLSTDCANVQGATGLRIAGFLQVFSSIVIGIIIGLFVQWDLSLFIAATIPLLLAAVLLESQYTKSCASQEMKAMENASMIAVEAITNIRTVASLGLEKHILERFNKEIELAEKEARKSTRYRGLVFSLNFCMNTFIYALAFLYAGALSPNKEIDYADVIKVIEGILYGAWMLGTVLNSAPNVGLAISSAQNIVKFLERVPASLQVETYTRNNEKVASLNLGFKRELDTMRFYQVSSAVDYKNVEFRYPTRPEVQILKGLSFEVPEGKTVALVGPSGCGKSTCVQVLLRFYDPEAGTVELDRTSIQDLPLGRLRSYLGLVSQEPVLFDRTIAENIAYGDNSREVSTVEIIEAAKEAQIHSEFVSKLPLGYDTPLGSRGTQLSGGQKQRIAIARALVRKPRILLLDEATSALDAESEKTVQNTLDKASENRTCIVIAHRLSTIRNADLICVIDRGQIAEIGTHNDLMNSEGLYSKLYQASRC